MDATPLKEVGLTDSEIRVYLALLELGDSTRGDIVAKSGIAGSKIYENLEKLQEKGLSSVYMRNKVKHFKPVNPDQLLSYLDDKRERIAQTERQVKGMLPALLSLYESSDEEQEVELLSGIKGLEIVFREQAELLRKGETCYVIGGTRGSDEAAVQAFFEKVHVWREQKGIRTKMLFNSGQKEQTDRLYPSRKYPGTETRYIPHTSPVAINVYKGTVAIIIFGKRTSAIRIRSDEAANSFMEYFDLLWKSASPATARRGSSGSRRRRR